MCAHSKSVCVTKCIDTFGDLRFNKPEPDVVEPNLKEGVHVTSVSEVDESGRNVVGPVLHGHIRLNLFSGFVCLLRLEPAVLAQP